MNTNWFGASALFILLVACSSNTTSSSPTTDGGACGERPVGSTCKKPAGGCEAQICVGSTWQCPEGDTEVGVTPQSCSAGDGGAGCGSLPVGSTCKKPSGACEPQICVGTAWKCPEGDTEVGVSPGSCSAGDASTD